MKKIIGGTFSLLVLLSCGKKESDEFEYPYMGVTASVIDVVTYKKLAGTKIVFAKHLSASQWMAMDSLITDSEGFVTFPESQNFHNYLLFYQQDYLPTLAVIPGLNQLHSGPLPDGWYPALQEPNVMPGGSGTHWVFRLHTAAFLQVDVKIADQLPPGKYYLKLELKGYDNSVGGNLYFKIHEIGAAYDVLPANTQANIQLAGNLAYEARMIIYNELLDGSVYPVKSSTKTIQVKPKENNQVQFEF